MKEELKKLGRFIKFERLKNGLSQEKFAEALGVSMRTISLIETGLQHPKFLLVLKMSKVLNFDLGVIKNLDL